MTRDRASLAERARTLQDAFDRTFAAPPRAQEASPEALLVLRVGPDGYALRRGEVAGVFAGKRITRVPSAVAEFLGVVGLRRAIVPVYDLRALLGAGHAEAPRWLVIAAGPAPAGLAFDALEGHEQVPREAMASEPHTRTSTEFVHGMVRLRERVLPVLDLPTIVQRIEQLTRLGRHKEP